MTLRITLTQQTAAAKAGISIASARRIERDPSTARSNRAPRIYRTRVDPLAGIWDEEIVPLLQASPGLRPVTIYHELCRRLPDRVDHAVRRTIERRIREWRAINGAERSVIFPQIQIPGRMGLSDFTDANGLGVMIGGIPLPHRLYHFAMAYSGFEHAEVVLGGESYLSMRLHVFPSCMNARKRWALPGADAVSSPDHAPAYAQLAEDGVDDCGLVQLSSRTVGAPFVGVVAAAMVVSEVIRRLNGAAGCEVVDLSLRDVRLRQVVPTAQSLRGFNPGFSELVVADRGLSKIPNAEKS